MMHPAQNNINIQSLFLIMNFNVTGSSAIASASMEGDQVTIAFTSNPEKEYTYRAVDEDAFQSAFVNVNAKGESVGKFITSAIKSEALVQNV